MGRWNCKSVILYLIFTPRSTPEVWIASRLLPQSPPCFQPTLIYAIASVARSPARLLAFSPSRPHASASRSLLRPALGLDSRDTQCHKRMDKLVEFGRRTWFFVKVLSGYEERRIRTYRLQLQRQLEQAQAKKAALRKLPEQIILSEVRQMVEQMQALNQQLEETEAAIEEYFKPIDKGAELLMSMQLEKEEKHAQEMVKMMRENVMLQREMAQKKFEVNRSDIGHPVSEKESVLPNQEQSN